MKYLHRIRQHGFIGSLRIGAVLCAQWINRLLYYVCWLLPINKRLIVFESEGDLSDNAYALYHYMLHNGYLEKYRVVWLVYDLKSAENHAYPNTVYRRKSPKGIDFAWSRDLASCAYFIYDHCNVFSNLAKREGCTIVNLWHGCGFKGEPRIQTVKTKPDYMVTIGEQFATIHSRVFGVPLGKMLQLGYPRNDFFFCSRAEIEAKVRAIIDLELGQKIFLWMPTFRKSDNKALNEDYFSSSTGLPIIETDEQLHSFNVFLKKNHALCVFKVHHLQSKLNVFQENFSNIRLLKDEEIRSAGLQLYQVLPFTDALITDYSSVAVDYMLLDKPTVYTVDDYSAFLESRGFCVDEPLKYFAGDCVVDRCGLESAMERIIGGQDTFGEQRNDLMRRLHKYPDGNSAQRILEFFGL